jgi:hypothetical protein
MLNPSALPIVDSCQGCERTVSEGESVYCQSYLNPSAKWRLGTCNFATHIKLETKTAAKINPLKASKRSTKKK